MLRLYLGTPPAGCCYLQGALTAAGATDQQIEIQILHYVNVVKLLLFCGVIVIFCVTCNSELSKQRYTLGERGDFHRSIAGLLAGSQYASGTPSDRPPRRRFPWFAKTVELPMHASHPASLH